MYNLINDMAIILQGENIKSTNGGSPQPTECNVKVKPKNLVTKIKDMEISHG